MLDITSSSTNMNYLMMYKMEKLQIKKNHLCNFFFVNVPMCEKR